MSDGKRLILFGRSGSGKSTLMNQIIRPARHLIVFDYLPTRRQTAGREGLTEITSLCDLRDAVRGAYATGFRLWYRPPPESQVQALHELSRFLFRLQAPIERGQAVPMVTLALDEASEAFPVTSLPSGQRGFYRVCKAGRHYRITVVAGTQRPAQVNTELRGNADSWYFFSLSEPADLDAVRRIAGKSVAGAVGRLPPYRYIRRGASGDLSSGHTKI